jgi:cation diffusion facilitator family transporter
MARPLPARARPPARGRCERLSLALCGYTLLFGLKLSAYFWTHLGIMFAEAMHSTADMLIVGFLLIATYMSKRPADSSFRFGYGRAQNIAALVAATIFISFTSFETLREAVPKLFEKVGAEGAALSATTFAIAIGVLLVSIVVSGIPFIPLLRNKNRSAAEKAQFIEVINDELALLAALIGIVLVNAGFALADPIASCVVAIIIAVNAVILWRENAVTLATHGVIAEKTGEQIHLSMHVEVERGTVIEEADAVADEVRKRLEAQVPDLYVVVHVDPADAQHSDRQ